MSLITSTAKLAGLKAQNANTGSGKGGASGYHFFLSSADRYTSESNRFQTSLY